MSVSGADTVTKTLIYGTQGKSDIDLWIGRVKTALSDFAKQVKSKNQWKEGNIKKEEKKFKRN